LATELYIVLLIDPEVELTPKGTSNTNNTPATNLPRIKLENMQIFLSNKDQHQPQQKVHAQPDFLQSEIPNQDLQSGGTKYQ